MKLFKFFLFNLCSIINLTSINLKFLNVESDIITKKTENRNYTKDILDTFQIMQGETEYDSTLWDSLYKCMKSDFTTKNLLDASDIAWRGIIQHGQENRTDDPWTTNTYWREHNFTKFPTLHIENADKIVILSPCSVASNDAYYRTFLTLCGDHKWSIPSEYVAAVKKSAVFQAFSSSFFHASMTAVGHRADNKVQDVFLLSIYQSAINSLPYDSVLFDLEPETGTGTNEDKIHSSLEIVDLLENMFINNSVYEWNEVFTKTNYASLYKSSGALIATGFIITLPYKDVLWISDLCKGLVHPDEYDFMVNKYLPRLQFALQNKKIAPSLNDKILIFRKTFGVFVKMLYGMIFMEGAFNTPIFYNPTVTYFGTLLMPFYNRFSNFLSGYNHNSEIFDKLQQESINVYPGRLKCAGKNFSHHIWHEQSGNGLVDMFYLADDINRILNNLHLSQ